MMMVRSSEHTTLQHTTLTSWGTSRGLCAHYGCRPAISRPMAPPHCPAACWRWGVQLGQGGGGAPPAGEAKEPARLHFASFAKGSSRSRKPEDISTRFAENRKNRNRLASGPSSPELAVDLPRSEGAFRTGSFLTSIQTRVQRDTSSYKLEYKV